MARRRRRRTPRLWEVRLRRWVRLNFSQPLLAAIADFEAGRITQQQFDQRKDALPFTLQSAMTACGLAFYNRNDYAKANGFFADERKKLEVALAVFISSAKYAQLMSSGASNDEVFRAFMIGALEHDVYPLFGDRADSNRFKVLERPDYLYLLELRTTSIANEVTRRAGELNALDPHFALKASLKRPALKDGSMFQLPPPTQRECPYGCGMMLPDNPSLAAHIDANH